MSIIVKDANSVDRYYETIEAGTVGNPFQSVVPDYRVPYAISQIENSFGDVVSVSQKKKSLIKFGRNNDIDSGVSETVWITGGNETYKTGNDIDIVVSTDAGDNQTITIEGHTLSGGDFTFVTQNLTLNGTTNVSLTTPLARATRLINTGSTDFAGTITVEDSGTSTHLTVNSNNQSQKCATTISSADYWIITSLIGYVDRTASATVDFKFQVRESGGVFRTRYEFTANSTGGASQINFDQPLIVRPNSDVRITATSGVNNTGVGATIEGYLAIIT